MISNKIIKLINNLDLDPIESQMLVSVIFRYTLKLDTASTLKNISCKLNIINQVSELKKELDISQYSISRFWRAVYSIYCCSKVKCDIKKVCQKYDVTFKDVKYVLDNNLIKNDELPKVNKKIKYLNIPNYNYIQEIINGQMAYIKFKVRRKLFFIYNYNNMDIDDFVHDIALACTKSLTFNDYIDDKEKLVAIIRNIVNQEICNIIARYTAKKRNRLIKVDSNSNGSFEQTTLSLDFNYFENDKNLYNIIDENNSNGKDVRSLINFVKSRVSDEEKKFIEMYLGNTNIPKKFLDYALRQYGSPFTKLKQKAVYKTITKGMNWSPARISQFKDKVKSILKEI